MSLARTLSVIWSRFAATATYEQDPGFRDIILLLSRKGMVVAGTIGIVGSVSNVAAYALAGWDFAFHYNDPTAIVLWDRLIIVATCTAYLLLARTHFGPRTDVAAEIDRIEGLIDSSAAKVKEMLDAGLDRDRMVAGYREWMIGVAAADGIDAAALEGGEEKLNPRHMSVDGIARYWRKRAERP